MIQKKKHKEISYSNIKRNKEDFKINFPDVHDPYNLKLYSAWDFYFYTGGVKIFYAFSKKTGYCCYATKFYPHSEDFRFRL